MTRIRWNGASGVMEGEIVRSRTEHLVKLDNGRYALVDDRSVTERTEDNKQQKDTEI